MSDPAEDYAISVSRSGVPDPKVMHAFNRGRRASNRARILGSEPGPPTDLPAAEGQAWLAGFDYQRVTWSAPLPFDDDSDPSE